MEQLFKKTGQFQGRCLLGCGWLEDKLEHYIQCSRYWQFVTARRPKGLGVAACHRTREGALLLSRALSEENIARLSLGLYALYRTLNYMRYNFTDAPGIDVPKLLMLFAKRGADGSKANSLLRFDGFQSL